MFYVLNTRYLEAATPDMGKQIFSWTVLTVSLCIFCGWPATVDTQISEKVLERTAQKLGSVLYRITKNASGHAEVEEGFRKAGMKVEKVDPLKEMSAIAEKVSEMLAKKVEGVKRLVEVAEESARSTPWTPAISINDAEFNYYNAKEMEKNESAEFLQMTFTANTRFHHEPVNVEASDIHIPTDVYNNSTLLLNGIHYSKALDATFKSNIEEDQTLRWQYFASSMGFLRLYPAVKWINPEEDILPDMYDCRLTNWYIRASNSPKDMMILLDISGSMTGIRRNLASSTTKEILNTLHEDDFFNIITFGGPKSNFLVNCTANMLVQATELNKKKFAVALGDLKMHDTAEMEDGLIMAFETFRSPTNNHSASCNKAIMIVSDGLWKTYDDVIAQYNSDSRVRIFSYVIGREVTAFKELETIACRNRGYVSHISTMSDIRKSVESYIPVLSRPIGLSGTKGVTSWSSDESRLGNFTGMVLTVAQPVFNRSTAAKSTGDLIGVVGIDVPIEDITQMMTPQKWGVGSYVFGVNHNGHIQFHPAWRPNVKRSTQPRRSYNDLDLGQVEFPLDTDDLNATSQGNFDLPLRKFMIDQASDHLQMKIKRQLDDRERVYEREYVYYFSGVKDAQLSIAVAIPVTTVNSGRELLQPAGLLEVDEYDGRSFLADTTTRLHLHPKWSYCNATFKTGEEMFYNLYPGTNPEDFQEEEHTGPVIACDTELVKALLFDLKATQPGVDAWHRGYEIQKDNKIETTFVVTRAGGTLWYQVPMQPPKVFLTARKITEAPRTVTRLTTEAPRPRTTTSTEGPDSNEVRAKRAASYALSARILQDPSEDKAKLLFGKNMQAVDEPFYERTVLGGHDVTVTSLAYDEFNSSIVASMPVFVIGPGQERVPAAVTGTITSFERLRQMLLEISNEMCKDLPTGSCLSCHGSSDVTCYLLDENAYIVLSSSTRLADYQGKLFGSGNLHGEIMQEIIERGIFKRYDLRDYQSQCIPASTSESKSSALKLRSWLKSVGSNLQYLVKYLLSIWSSTLLPSIHAQEDLSVESDESVDESEIATNATSNQTTTAQAKPPVPIPCDMSYQLYHSQWNALATTFQYQCLKNCTKTVGVFKVSTTNLLLIAMDKVKTCPCSDTSLAEPKEILYEGISSCARYKTIPYRYRPQDCFHRNANEDTSDCSAKGRSGSLSLSADHPLICLLVFFIFRTTMTFSEFRIS